MSVLVSIIVCTANRSQHLSQTLASIAQVRVPPGIDAELIVVDNASTDDTACVVRKATPGKMNLRYIYESKRGKSHALNSGLASSGGDIILFTDDDVCPPENWILGMCGPILSGKAHAVAGGVRIAAHLERPWMEPLHRNWLSSTEGLDPIAPQYLVGANMAFSREVLTQVSAFDPELGPGALGFGEEQLLGLQIVESGSVIAGELGVTVDHHFEENRLLRVGFLESARKRGRTKAYMAYHWYHSQDRSPYFSCLKAAFRLAYWRMRKRRDCGQVEGCSLWEMYLVRDLHYHKQYLIERRRARNYEKLGLTKLYQ
jgi:glycosyltransferase involved in cell wall biosynthesis